MEKLKSFNRPLFILVLTIVALGVSYYLYLDSYLRFQAAMAEFVSKYKLEDKHPLDTNSWVIILTLSILLALIIVGMSVIYVYYQKMIQLYRMQQNFINGFTHELKTPIASLRLFLDTFYKHELPRQEQLKYIDFMKRDTERLADNVEQILYLGRIEDRSYKGEMSLVDLSKFMESLIEKARHLHEDLDITLINDGENWCHIDRRLFEALVLNLISNADRYKKGDSGKLQVSISGINTKCQIDFKDDGIGIEKKFHKKIFKKFFQVGKSAKGSGLGLYFVWQVIKMHKGQIWVESEGRDSGVLFTMTIPRVKFNE